MIKVMERRGHRVKLLSSISATLITLICFAFVDDTDLPCVASSVYESGESVALKFQKSLDDWAGTVKATGGELEPSKSWCYLIDFSWNRDKWVY